MALSDGVKFCASCGQAVRSAQPESGLLGGFRSKVKVLGDKTTSVVTQRAKGMVTQERASEAVRNMLKIVTHVAQDVRRELPPDMVKAIDLEAEVSFIAFSIGVTVDLEQLSLSKQDKVARSLQ
jgi:sugar-specific transcriptional regulator TrmB